MVKGDKDVFLSLSVGDTLYTCETHPHSCIAQARPNVFDLISMLEAEVSEVLHKHDDDIEAVY